MKYILLGVALLMLQAGTAEGGLFGFGNKNRIRGNEAKEPELPAFPRGEGGGPSTKIPTCIFSPPAGSEDPIVCIGRVLYPRLKGINKVLRFTTGKPISEWAWIRIFRTICCITYMYMAFWGFRTLPMPVMIVVGICTSWIGPVMAFFLIGMWLAPVWFFVKAPILSMNVMCVAYMVASGLGQNALHYLGLDQDGDGDVDMVDIGRAIVKKMPLQFGGGGPPEGGLAPGLEYPDADLHIHLKQATEVDTCTTYALKQEEYQRLENDYKLKHDHQGKLWRYLTFLNDGLEDQKQKQLLEQINTLKDEVAEMTLNQKIKDTEEKIKKDKDAAVAQKKDKDAVDAQAQKDNKEIEKYRRVLKEMNYKKNIKDAEANVKSLELKQSAAKANVKSLELKQSAAKIKTEKTTQDQEAQKIELEKLEKLENAKKNAKKQLLDAKIESAIWFIKEGKNTK